MNEARQHGGDGRGRGYGESCFTPTPSLRLRLRYGQGPGSLGVPLFPELPLADVDIDSTPGYSPYACQTTANDALVAAADEKG